MAKNENSEQLQEEKPLEEMFAECYSVQILRWRKVLSYKGN